MKILFAVSALLSAASSWAQTDTIVHRVPIKNTACEPHSFIATIALGFIDNYRVNYTPPPGFTKNNISGFAPVIAHLEYAASRHISIAGTFGYDNFNNNISQIYEGYTTSFARYISDNTRIFSLGLNVFYHFRHLLPSHFDPFAGVGLSLNNIRYSAYPQGDTTTVKTDHSATPYLKAGTRYYLSDKFSFYGDAGYNKHTIIDLGFSVRFVKTRYLADRDGDGVPDIADSCADVRGIARLHGCPDSDGDGIPDREDSCPHEVGLAQYHGCPDSDGDGVSDNADLCPHQKGLAQFHGCPDSDGDGIPDNEDLCPDKKGLAQFQGCPDTDGDGIPDSKDGCPFEAGPPENNGCPVKAEPPASGKELTLPISVIQFQLGKSTISKSSLQYLDKVAEMLRDNTDVGLRIDGYADITGTPTVNSRISQARAESIKKYLVHKGVGARRIITKGHGSKWPAATNRTRAGRAKNRRATLKLEYNSHN